MRREEKERAASNRAPFICVTPVSSSRTHWVKIEQLLDFQLLISRIINHFQN